MRTMNLEFLTARLSLLAQTAGRGTISGCGKRDPEARLYSNWMERLDMKIQEFEADLDRWEARYKGWAEPIDQFIRTALFKVNRDGYTLADFQREREAMVAQQHATYDPQPEIEGILDRMCAEYLNATPQEREHCRSLVSDRKAVLNALLGYVHSAAKRVSSANDIDHLRLGLAAASIENCATDYRDDLVAFAGIWVAAERAGIDPSPYFRAVAKLSSDKEPRGGETPVSEIMNNLQDYAVVSECRAAQGEWPPGVLGAKNKK
jgi:hypothetical protein